MKKLIISVLLLALFPSAVSCKTAVPVTSPNSSASSAAQDATATPSEDQPPSPIPSFSSHSMYGVQTDFSNLTPYEPMAEIYTRLSPDYMPELVPSDDYGMLLPYVGEVLYEEYGYPLGYRYGLMTAEGMLVTDPVYSSVSLLDQNLPIYVLGNEITPTDSDKMNIEDPTDVFRYCICADDGSWTSPSDYKGVLLRNKTIILIRDFYTNDADVYDLTGKLLYTTVNLESHERIRDLAYYALDDMRDKHYDEGYSGINVLWTPYLGDEKDSYGEDCYPIELFNGNYAYVSEQTGEIISAEYENAKEFSDGLAAVSKNGQWGFIDRDFSVVIPFQYAQANNFFSGYSLVELSDGTYSIINTHGNTVLSAVYIYLRYDMYEVEKDGDFSYYDIRLNKLTPDNPDACLAPIGGGWYITDFEDTSQLFRDGKLYAYPGVFRIMNVVDDLLICQMYIDDAWGMSVLTLEGKTLIPFCEDSDINIYKNSESGQLYIVVHNYQTASSYVINPSGDTVLSSDGSIAYKAQADLFAVNAEQYFSYISSDGRLICRMSLLDSVPD